MQIIDWTVLLQMQNCIFECSPKLKKKQQPAEAENCTWYRKGAFLPDVLIYFLPQSFLTNLKVILCISILYKLFQLIFHHQPGVELSLYSVGGHLLFILEKVYIVLSNPRTFFIETLKRLNWNWRDWIGTETGECCLLGWGTFSPSVT